MPARRALITGLTGQDGGYLAEQLIASGREVFGLVRPGQRRRDNLAAAPGRLTLIKADICSLMSLEKVMAQVRPREVFHLAAQSNVAASLEDPRQTTEVTAMGALNLFEAAARMAPQARILFASSSEIFGAATASPQDEATPLAPRNPYGWAKALAHEAASLYRARGLFICRAILYNHESPRRPEGFVTRKLTLAAARVKLGLAKSVRLGRVDAVRDWGYAPDYTRAMRMMLEADAPGDYVLATGTGRTVAQFAEAAFAAVGLDWQDHVIHEPGLTRDEPGAPLIGNPARAREQLGWRPGTSFERMVEIMVAADLERAGQK